MIAHPIAEQAVGLNNRLHAQIARLQKEIVGFVSGPDPHLKGDYLRGLHFLDGTLRLEGGQILPRSSKIWEKQASPEGGQALLHSFTWLADLAEVGDKPARTLAQEGVFDWIDQFGRGKGQGWAAETTGIRVINWINATIFVLNGLDRAKARLFFRSLAHQSAFLSRRWQSANSGLPRFEALSALLYASYSLEGLEKFMQTATAGFSVECRRIAQDELTIASRRADEISEIIKILVWAGQALKETGQNYPENFDNALSKLNEMLHGLKHSSGSLTRFHGSGKSEATNFAGPMMLSGRTQDVQSTLGYLRLSSKNSTLIADTSLSPIIGKAPYSSPLAFEFSHGNSDIIVSSGSAQSFSQSETDHGRYIQNHSTLTIGRLRWTEKNSKLPDNPVAKNFEVQPQPVEDGVGFSGTHDAWRANFGLLHSRLISMNSDGLRLEGEDRLSTLTEDDKVLFDQQKDSVGPNGLWSTIHFHLHPDLDVSLDLDGMAVSIRTKSGEIWVLHTYGVAKLAVDSTVYYDRSRVRPRTSKQIVCTRRINDYSDRVRWTLAKAVDELDPWLAESLG